MKKDLIEQYNDLLEEQKENEERILKTEQALQRLLDDGTTKDSVKGGEGGIQHFVIEGYPTPDISRQRQLLAIRRAQLRDTQMKIAEKIIEVQGFIDSIDNSYMRRIITMRVIDRKTWVQIAMSVGGGNTPDSVRMSYNRFFEDCA